MHLADYVEYDALGLAELVRKGETNARELADLAFAALAQVNPAINAVVETWPDDVPALIDRAPAGAVFSGVPFLIKDAVLHMAGRACEYGSRLAAGLCREDVLLRLAGQLEQTMPWAGRRGKGMSMADKAPSARMTVARIVGFGAIVPLALLTAPVLARQLTIDRGLSPAQVGVYFLFELGGISVASLPAAWTLRQWPTGRVALIAALAFVAGNAASLLAPSYAALIAGNAGLPAQAVANRLAVASLMGIAGAGCAAWLGNARNHAPGKAAPRARGRVRCVLLRLSAYQVKPIVPCTVRRLPYQHQL